jgi:hypothetical protein
VLNRSLFFIDPQTGETKGTMVHPRPQTNRENCTWHNFNVVPTKAGYYATVGSYQSGISVLEFTNPAAPREIAYADPAPLQNPSPEQPTAAIILGGDWSTYWHNGFIYEHDIKRGLITWRLNLGNDATMTQANAHLAKTNTFATSNPQTQAVSYAPDAAPTITVASPVEGQAFKVGSTAVADFACADNDLVESCVGTVADDATLTMSSLGNKVFRVTATDSAGNIVTKDVPYMVNSVDTALLVNSGALDTTMALTFTGNPPAFQPFEPGVAREYTVAAAPRITSTTGNTALTVSDPSETNVGKLVNGTTPLANTLQAYANSATGIAGAGGNIGGTAAPTPLLTFAAPVSNAAVNLVFRQNITSTEPLRTGTYSKTLTFTLSTTAP